jgi:glycerophosphoryl diester phosphodiesterase
MMYGFFTARRCGVLAAVLMAACSGESNPLPPLGGEPASSITEPTLVGYAKLPAATFAPGPTSGAHLGADPDINLQPLPFVGKQPVQGFSAVHDRGDGTFLAMADNGFGAIENSADFNLRVYKIRPDFKTADGGTGEITVEGYVEISDPYKKIPWTITNHFTPDRVLTGADLDIESMMVAPDGTLWFGDEFGPFLIHADQTGRLLDPPIPLPDLDDKDKKLEVRSPQNPFNEEATTVRIMNAVSAHARSFGNKRVPVVSPAFQLLVDGDEATVVDSRKTPPDGSGLGAAASEIMDVESLHKAGYPIVPYTVNDLEQMLKLMKLGVDGIISDRPDLLRQALAAFDADENGTPGDYLDEDGLIDPSKFDAQGHRGGRNLRPENTLPAFEVALDNLMSTLELDAGIASDGIPVVSHDPHIQAEKCRRADGAAYEPEGEVLIKDFTAAELQATYVCDKLFRGPEQLNGAELSPVTAAFALAERMPSIYAVPRLEQVFAFVDSYIAYYKTGAGSLQPEASLRWRNAQRVRFNIETKVNPHAQYASRTIDADDFAEIVASTIAAHGLEERADIQSFDARTLLYVQEMFPEIRTVYLFGDFPLYDDATIAGSDDSTNLQDDNGQSTPWLAGMYWPYRTTALTAPFRAQQSGGFEGMALSPDGTKLFPLLEKTLTAGTEKTLLIHEFDLAKKAYTGVRYDYVLEGKGTNIGDFILVDDTRGLVIERDGTKGDLTGFKTIYEVTLPEGGGKLEKKLAVDLMKIKDPEKLSPPGSEGDIGVGEVFAFPFTTIEAVVLLGPSRIGVLNDNNYPFDAARHAGTKLPDDDEFIVIDLGRKLVSK